MLRPLHRFSTLSYTAIIVVIVSTPVAATVDAVATPITTFYLPTNAQSNDELLADIPLKVDAGKEHTAISLEPLSETIVVSPAIVGPKSPVHLFVVDPQRLRNEGGESLKLHATTLVSGKELQVPLEVKAEISEHPIDAVPFFEKNDYKLLLEHNFEDNEIAIVKLRSEPPPNTRFNLIGPLSERFAITREGQLIYLATIPCETPCITPSTFTVLLVAERGNAQQTASITIDSKGSDRLRFLGAPYDAIVEEETGLFEKALKVRTSGANGEVLYTLQDPTGLFSIHPEIGLLTVQHPEFLTQAGFRSQFNLTVTATDKKTQVKSPISISLLAAAQRPKIFSFVKDSYSFTVAAGVSLIGMVELVGAENNTIEFGIAEGGQGAVNIDDQGVLYYQRGPEKESRNFTVLVLARSTVGQYLAATTWVEVFIEGLHSNPPLVIDGTEQMIAVDAQKNVGSRVAAFVISDDDEDATLQLSIVSISGVCLNGSAASELKTDIFQIQMIDHQAELSLNKPLVDLPLASLSLEIDVQDLTHTKEPSVKVIQHVAVSRNHILVTGRLLPFQLIKLPRVVEISGEANVRSIVYRPMLLQSIISNSTALIYDIESSSGAFEIDHSTGTITTTRTFNESSKALIMVTVVDSSAEERTQGAIRLKDSVINVPRSDLSFVAKAEYLRTSSTVPIHITVSPSQENVELFFENSSYEVKVMENLPVNGYVLSAELLISDSSGVEYFIDALNDANIIKDILDIDLGGRITVKEELQGNAGTHEFQIRAIKGRQHASADVKLHILRAYKCIPVFLGAENIEFIVKENSPAGLTIGTASAATLDSKCELKYHLWDARAHKYTSETDIASIDVNTGRIRSRVPFDYEEKSNYPLVLGLQAGAHHFAQLASTLRILDVDDHPLTAVLDNVTVEVPEDVATGTLIATMRAVDNDESQTVFYRFRLHSKESKKFALNATTGEVTVVSSLDREINDIYRLEIGAINNEDAKTNEIMVWMSLRIRVADVNDNGPLFERSHYFALVSKTTLPGDEIVTVSAFDPDRPTPENGLKEVYYSIKEVFFEYHGMKRTVEGLFAVKPSSGVVVLEQTVHDFVGGVFHLLLESIDREANDNKDQSILKVYIHDESDIVCLELQASPVAVTYAKVDTVKKTIADTTGFDVLVKDLQYHHEEGSVIYDITNLRLVLVNRTTSEIAPAERAIAVADKHRSSMGPHVPIMKISQTATTAIIHHSIPPLAYVLSVFALSLTMILTILGLMMCHYRNRFKRDKKLREDDNAIANALVRPPLRLTKISPTMSTRTVRTSLFLSVFSPHIPAVEGQYAVQEMRVVVGGSDDEHRWSKPW
nr:Cadherin domain containing protein [Haemonchus contortus]